MSSGVWSVEGWMEEHREVVEAALAGVGGDRMLVPERAFIAYALVELDASCYDDGEEES